MNVEELVHSIPLVSVEEQDDDMDKFMAREITLYLLQNYGVFIDPDTVYKCIDSFKRNGGRSKYVYRIVLRYIASRFGIDIWGLVSYQLYKYYLDKDIFNLCKDELEKEAEKVYGK